MISPISLSLSLFFSFSASLSLTHCLYASHTQIHIVLLHNEVQICMLVVLFLCIFILLIVWGFYSVKSRFNTKQIVISHRKHCNFWLSRIATEPYWLKATHKNIWNNRLIRMKYGYLITYVYILDFCTKIQVEVSEVSHS